VGVARKSSVFCAEPTLHPISRSCRRNEILWLWNRAHLARRHQSGPARASMLRTILPFGDIVDSEDETYNRWRVHVRRCVARSRLFYRNMRTRRVERERMRFRARGVSLRTGLEKYRPGR